MPKTKSKRYCRSNYSKGWKIFAWEKKTNIHLLAPLPTSCQLRNFLQEFTKKVFAIFRQSSCSIVSCVLAPPIFLGISSFIFVIRIEQFWIWFSQKLAKNVKISIVFLILPSVWLSNIGSDLSVGNMVGLGSTDTKDNTQDAVKNLLELARTHRKVKILKLQS